MKIKNLKSAEIFKKCLAAKQLEAYAGLRIIMENFNKLHQQEEERNKKTDNFNKILSDEKDSKPLPNRIDNLLKAYLPFVARGDLSFFEKTDFELALDGFRSNVRQKIKDNFQNYANFSISYSNFKYADTQLDTCFEQKRDGSLVLSSKKLEDYNENVLKKSGDLEEFATHFAKHSPTFLKHEGFVITREALAAIGRVQLKDDLPPKFSNITPATFDANIRGYQRLKQQEETIEYFSQYEDKKVNNISESIYKNTVGKHYEKKFTGDKTNFKRIAKIAAAFGLTAFIALESFSYFDKFDNINIDNSTPQVSATTIAEIRKIEDILTTLKTSSELPTEDQLSEIRMALDDNNNQIISDLVTDAFEKEKTDCSVNFVKMEYNDYNAKNGDESNIITVEYTDENGNTQTKRITNFSDFGRLSSVFADERDFDKEFYALIDKAFDEENNFEERSSASADVVDFLIEKLENQKNIAALKMTYEDNLIFPDSLGFSLPEQESEKTSKDTSIGENHTIEDEDYTH